ncbi:MAG: DEAD/DEAH box helicase [Alphaproteobacteria bacterium]
MTIPEGVVPALREALQKREYTELTPVQEAVLAPELTDADLLVSAQTGSGKTVAFGLSLAPTLLSGAERFPRADAPLALVVAPTRELALQVKRELEWLYQETGAAIASCVGGMDMRTERNNLNRGAHIVVGTPGRLRDHIERGSLNTKSFRAIVLDEADEMLDLGFRDDLEYILDSAPAERRTLMFSATVPRAIATLAKRYQRDAVRVSTKAEREQHVDIEYRALAVAPNDRENAIINLLRYYEAQSALVFCATRATVNHMASRFTNRGFSVVSLSGELSQNERSHALQAMRDGRARVCIATDVAARGIDLPNLELVIHADIPRNSETLLHRSGRTGRAGRKGVCAIIVPYNTRSRAERLLRGAGVKADWGKPPSVDDIMKRDDERILADPALNEPVREDEQAFIATLLAQHSPEQVAAAFTRLYRANRSAPEELLDSAPMPQQSRERPHGRDRDQGRSRERSAPASAGFSDGVWFSLSVGRKHTAEARWLLPMLCRAGHVTKDEIGAIRVQYEETYVELAPDCIDRFLQAVGPGGKVERTVSVTRLPGKPDLNSPDGPPAGRGDTRRDTRREAVPDRRPAARPDRHTNRTPAPEATLAPRSTAPAIPEPRPAAPVEGPHTAPTAEKPYTPRKPRNDAAPAADKPGTPRKPRDKASPAATKPATGRKPWDKGPAKNRGKKYHKPVKPRTVTFNKGVAQDQEAARPGCGPMKRK